MANNC